MKLILFIACLCFWFSKTVTANAFFGGKKKELRKTLMASFDEKKTRTIIKQHPKLTNEEACEILEDIKAEQLEIKKELKPEESFSLFCLYFVF